MVFRTGFLVVGVGIRLQGIDHMLLDIPVSVGNRQQALLCICYMLFGFPFLPWALEYQMEDVANEQSKQGHLWCHAEDADHEANVETQSWDKTNNSRYQQDG